MTYKISLLYSVISCLFICNYSKAEEFKPTIYTFFRPPSSVSGTVDSKGNYYEFTNARPSECDFKVKQSCFIEKPFKGKIISPGILKIGDVYGCSDSIIKNAITKNKSLLERHKYFLGYGKCTKNGWIPKENFSRYVYYIENAIIKHQKGNKLSAFKDLDFAINTHPLESAAYFERGKIRDQENDPIRAIADYAKVIDIDPEFAKTYKLRGLARKKLGDLKGACEDWKKAAELGDEDAAELLKEHCQ